MRIADTSLNSDHPSHDWFEELCALAVIGELSPAEFRELQSHLTDCDHCRKLYFAFGRISSQGLGLLAAQREPDSGVDEAADQLDGQALLARLNERLGREREAKGEPVLTREETHAAHRFAPIWRWLRSPVPAYLAMALVLAAGAGISGYRLRGIRQRAALEQLQSQAFELRRQAAAALEEIRSKRDGMQEALDDAQTKYSDLLTKRKNLESELRAANAHVAQLRHDVEAARSIGVQKLALQQESEHRLQLVLNELNQLRQSSIEASRRAEEQEKVIANLTANLDRANRLAATEPGPLTSDFEARELFGARDLHIVDVYDVDHNGKTRRTYGRVYYVEKKLLLFYAFDLQDKRRHRAAAAFQAWGYREPRGKPENLGLFYVDDASVNRWVLKVNNPRVLEHVDAVFVTLEPPGGSPSPSGRKLLYASLSGAPNHP